ncbi:MAG: DUF4143 domain-containing protein [Candidatus Methanoplasma sp.]|jgi:predicted AAA+ superfamily ATPase|nr:DUF4143 domain-containing protein [Candidatus Methanoplasma sp.]
MVETRMIPDEEIRKRYRPRVIDSRVSRFLSVFGGVQITGCKWCGKSWTGIYHSKSSAFIGTESSRMVAEADPEFVLRGEEPRLIDEWQDVPNLWDVARMNIDFAARKGMYIFTGSSVPPIKSTSHTGTGRFTALTMRPMSLFESGDSNGSVSVSGLFEGRAAVSSVSKMNYETAVRLICRGGWPGGLAAGFDDALLIPRLYLESLVNSDLLHIDGIKRNPEIMRSLLRSLARNNATAVKTPVLAADMAKWDSSVSEQTARNYIGALGKVFVIEEQPAWTPSLRSRKRMRTSPKMHLADPSLAAAAMGAGPEMILNDPKTAGFLFESLCYRDLSVYSSAFGGRVSHYRDDSGLEVDSIVEYGDGRWGSVEVRIGYKEADRAAANLLRLKNKLADETAPSFMMVLCATGGAAYMRKDGVSVVPIDCLGP